jgi:hypothetical protein
MIARRDNWPDLLAAYIESKRSEPFAWGSNDCCLFAADWIKIATGHDIAAQWRGSYTTALGARRALDEGGGIERLVEKAGGIRIETGLAQRGDLVAQESGNGVALGICLGVVAAFISSDGVQFLPLHEASIWRF